MSTVKISELPLIPILNQDTTQTLIAGVDLVTGITGKMTTKVLATSLYSNDVLNVGNNSITFPGVIGQFAGHYDPYMQINIQNLDANGTADYVITGDTGTDTTNYLDLGFTNSLYDVNSPYNSLGTLIEPRSGYLYVQGTANSGNLVIGTTGSNTEIRFFVGGANTADVNAKITQNNLMLLNGTSLIYSDNTKQYTASAPWSDSNTGFSLANSSFAKANNSGNFANGAFTTANSAGVFANSAFQAANNVAATASSLSITLLNTQNYVNGVYTLSNTSATTLTATQSYANGAFGVANGAASYANGAFTKANNALANTSGTFGGDLFITGNANVGSHMVIANNNYDYSNTSLVKISGAIPAVVPPANPGYMLELVGINGTASRLVNTGYGSNAYALFAGRHANGTAASPTAVANNDVIARFSGSGHNGTAFTTTGQGRIDIVADEDFTTANNGSRIEFYNTIPKTNTVTKIASFNSNTVIFTGAVSPQKGFIWTPRIPAGNQTAITIDYSTDSIVRANLVADLTISHTNYTAGKVVDVWLTNNDNANHTVTHGCAALRSTNKSTTFTITSGSSAYVKFFSIDGDNANTFVTIIYQ